jgi:hypothetical protein
LCAGTETMSDENCQQQQQQKQELEKSKDVLESDEE